MALTPAQLATLRSTIDADGGLNSQPLTADGAAEIARLLNLDAAPNFTVWKTLVAIGAVGSSIVASELSGLSSLNATRLQTLAVLLSSGVNPSRADTRAFFDDIFSGAGGAGTRASLLTLWKRFATRGEKIFAAGAGTDGNPALLVVEGRISATDVQAARAL